MAANLKKTIKVLSFVIWYSLISNSFTMDNVSLLEEVISDLPVRFTPRCKIILQPEFNPVARALYNDCISRKSIEGKNALEGFKRTYPDLSKLEETIREYIENIHLVQVVIYGFIEKLNAIKSKSGVERLLPLISARESLILGVAHCAYDFNNDDLSFLEKSISHLANSLYGTNMVKDVTIGRDGIVQMLNGIPTSSTERECSDHPDFGTLCATTKQFIDDLLKITPIIDKLLATDRLKKIAPVIEK